MKQILIIVCCVAFSSIVSAQEIEKEETSEDWCIEEKEVENDDAGLLAPAFEQPTLTACEYCLTPEERKKCTGDSILTFIQKNFTPPIEIDSVETPGYRNIILIVLMIKKNGQVGKVEIAKDFSKSKAGGKEALRVAQLLTEKYGWIPAKRYGKPFDMKFYIPFKWKKD